MMIMIMDVPKHYSYVVVMNLMFSFPAGVASCIAACRSFVSLTTFRPKNVYVHAAVTHPTTHRRPSGGSGGGNVIHISASGDDCPSNNGLAKTNRAAGIVFGNKAACLDSVGQGYGLDQLEPRTINAPAAANSKGGYDFRGANGSGEVVSHADMIMQTHSSVA
jgi:hypothetical protein